MKLEIVIMVVCTVALDGSYSPLQHNFVGNHIWCTRKDGTKIIQPMLVAYESCECIRQRDAALRRASAGVHVPQCQVNGLFQKNQCTSFPARCWHVNVDTGERID